MRTIVPIENEGHQEICAKFAQNLPRPADKRVKFPVTIRHRSSTAKICRPAGKFNCYRVAYTVAGKRRMQTFAAYSDAKAAAERIVRDTANGSQAAALSASQSRAARAALPSLESFRQSTGRAVSLLAAVWVKPSRAICAPLSVRSAKTLPKPPPANGRNCPRNTLTTVNCNLPVLPTRSQTPPFAIGAGNISTPSSARSTS